MARDLPGSVVNSLRVLGLIVATSGVITLLIWAMFLTGYRMTLERSHIAVDLLTHGRSLRRRRALGIVATLGLTAFGSLLAGSGVLETTRSWAMMPASPWARVSCISAASRLRSSSTPASRAWTSNWAWRVTFSSSAC